jgi:hypothetical protein
MFNRTWPMLVEFTSELNILSRKWSRISKTQKIEDEISLLWITLEWDLGKWRKTETSKHWNIETLKHPNTETEC